MFTLFISILRCIVFFHPGWVTFSYSLQSPYGIIIRIISIRLGPLGRRIDSISLIRKLLIWWYFLFFFLSKLVSSAWLLWWLDSIIRLLVHWNSDYNLLIIFNFFYLISDTVHQSFYLFSISLMEINIIWPI